MSRPAKILFLAANPSDTTPLLIDEEIRQIEQRIRRGEYRKLFTVETAPALRATDLPLVLMEREPDVVHFSGHGSKRGELYLLSDEFRLARPVSPATLGRVFKQLGRSIKCVLLNACDSEEQAQAIVGSVPCVIAMSRAMPDPAAIAFSAGFYEALAFGKSIAEAFKLGQLQVELADPLLAEFADIPILLSQPGTDATKCHLLPVQTRPASSLAWPGTPQHSSGTANQTQHIGTVSTTGQGNQVRIAQRGQWKSVGEASQEVGDISVGGNAQPVTVEQKHGED